MDRPQDEEIELIPDTCSCNRGKLHKGFTKHIVEIGNEVIVIRIVPAWICDLCGESYITPTVSEKIDGIIAAFRAGRLLSKPIAAGQVHLTMSAQS
jgi:YgiT-type zinc finger domain-containing protein